MPANFPPSGTATRELSGMGTPDMLGTYGTSRSSRREPFAFERPGRVGRRRSAGRRASTAWSAARSRARRTRICVTPAPTTRRPFDGARRSARSRRVKIVVGDRGAACCGSGEWSDWLPVELAAGPDDDPARRGALLPEAARARISSCTSARSTSTRSRRRCRSRRRRTTRRSWRGRPAASTRRGCPRTRKSLNAGRARRPTSCSQQARITADENLPPVRLRARPLRRRLALLLLRPRRSGVAHDVAARWTPGIRPTTRRRRASTADVVEDALRADRRRRRRDGWPRLGPDDLLVVMSDHGFTSWRRSFHLNSWLRDHGYLDAARRRAPAGSPGCSATWTGRARAPTALGSERAVRQRRRAARGRASSPAASARRWPTRSPRKLLATIDPATGTPAVTRVFRREQRLPAATRTSTSRPISSSATRGHARCRRLGARRRAAAR